MIATRSALVGACGMSAGVHGALFATHVRDLPGLAVSFLVAVVLLCGVAFLLVARPDRRWPAGAAAPLFAGLLAAYFVAAHDPLDVLAVVTKTVEAAGLVLALALFRVREDVQPQGGPLSIFALALAVGLMLGGHGHAQP